MSSFPNRTPAFMKNSWARWAASLFIGESAAGSRPASDLERVLETGTLDADVLAKHLRGISLFGSSNGEVQGVQVRGVLKYHTGRRCTVDAAVRTGDGWQPLIAKIYRKDRSDIFEAMRGIQRAGFGLHGEFSISQPIAYVPALHCLLSEKVEGARGDEILKGDDGRSRAGAAERSALWLARFHVFAPKAGKACHARDHLSSDSVKRSMREIAKAGGTLASKAEQLFRRLEKAAASLCTVALSPGHGSYSAAQVMLSEGRTVAFDWDRYCVADPAQDIGRFLTALRRLALVQHGSVKALDTEANLFLRTYLAVGQPEAVKNLRFFEATGYMKWAKHLVCHPVPHGEEYAEVMLDEGLRVLDGGPVHG